MVVPYCVMVVAQSQQTIPLGGGMEGHLAGKGLRYAHVDRQATGLIDYEAYPFTSSDDYVLTLYRRRPLTGTPPRSRPVLFLHGANSNRYCFGVRATSSFTGYLNRHGFDVWVLEFRGNRSSRYVGKGKPSQNLDAKIQIDLPTAIDKVLRTTGADKLDLIGHSLGGIFIYAYLGANPCAPVGRAITLCSPAHVRRFFGSVSGALKLPAKVLAPIARRIPGLGVPHLARLRGPLPHLASLARHIDLQTLTSGERRDYLDHAVEDMTGGDLAQLMRWFGDGGLATLEGGSYYDVFSRVQHPVLVMGSAGDRIAEPSAVREAFDRLGCSTKKLLFVGRSFGSTRNYSHQDLLLAGTANQDVFPHARFWLEQHESLP